jgi:uncharacterized protein
VHNPAGERLVVDLNGGEPLLRIDLLPNLVDCIRDLELQTKTPIKINITTNGTLLTPALLEFMKVEDIGLSISLDGPHKVHDRCRRFSEGFGSYATVLENTVAALECLTEVQVNAVYTPQTTAALPETVAFFTELNITDIQLLPNLKTSWEGFETARLAEVYLQIARHYIDCFARGKSIALNLLDRKFSLMLNKAHTQFDLCPHGSSAWTVHPRGTIYPCACLAGDDQARAYFIGDVHQGLVAAPAPPWSDSIPLVSRSWPRCGIQRYCTYRCANAARLREGQADSIGQMGCASEKAAMEAALTTLNTLFAADNELFLDRLDHFLPSPNAMLAVLGDRNEPSVMAQASA